MPIRIYLSAMFIWEAGLAFIDILLISLEASPLYDLIQIFTRQYYIPYGSEKLFFLFLTYHF